MTLEAVCHLITDGKHGDCRNQYGSGYYFLSAKDVKEGRLQYAGARQITREDFLHTHKRTQLGPGDVLISNSGTIGRIAIADDSEYTRRTTFQKSVAIIKPDRERVHPRWLYYYLQGAQEELVRAAGGTAQKNLLLRDLRSFPIDVPAIDVQRRIAAVLSAYDDLIETSTRRIQILEEMAQAIYREWFVDFRFPGHEQLERIDSELGPIPSGWSVRTIPQAIELNPRVVVPRHGEKPFVPMSSISTSSMLIENIEARTGNSGSKFQNGDTLFARITPCLENGKTGFVQFLSSANNVAFGSTEFIVLRSRTLSPEIVYLLARSEPFRAHAIKSMSGATGRQRVQEGCFTDYLIIQPPQDIIDRFAALVSPMFESIHALAQRNVVLRHTRDLLLPRLMSGELPTTEVDELAS